MPENLHQTPAPALERGLFILELLGKYQELNFNKLKDITGYNTSSLNRLLKTLITTGYITKNSNRNYELGIKTFILQQEKSVWNYLVEYAQPELSELSEKFAVTAILLGYRTDNITVLAKHAHQDNVMLRQVGAEKPDFLLSPWGYLYIAELPEERRPAFFDWARNASAEVSKLPANEELNNIVRFVKENHYADDKGKILRRGIRRLAAPVYGPNRDLIAAVGIGTFSGQITEEDITNMANTLIAKAQKLTRKMQGY